jgi:4-aminobutyrate aminotransferase-like enzyme
MRREWNIIGDVRGKGLMIGVELIEGNQDDSDQGLSNPLNGRAISHIKNNCLKMGLLIGIGGNKSNVDILRFKTLTFKRLNNFNFYLNVSFPFFNELKIYHQNILLYSL